MKGACGHLAAKPCVSLGVRARRTNRRALCSSTRAGCTCLPRFGHPNHEHLKLHRACPPFATARIQGAERHIALGTCHSWRNRPASRLVAASASSPCGFRRNRRGLHHSPAVRELVFAYSDLVRLWFVDCPAVRLPGRPYVVVRSLASRLLVGAPTFGGGAWHWPAEFLEQKQGPKQGPAVLSGLVEFQDIGNRLDQQGKVAPERPVKDVIAVAIKAGSVA